MADEAKVAESPEPEADLKSLTDAVQALVQLRIAEAAAPKAVEIPATDPDTQPDYKASGAVAEVPEVEADDRFAKGFLPLPVKDFVEDRKSINVTSFPRGDAENFSLTRYCYALSKAQGVEGTPALRKYAPWESAYYEAAKKITTVDPITKAQGDMVSGQDGGFLAPEFFGMRNAA